MDSLELILIVFAVIGAAAGIFTLLALLATGIEKVAEALDEYLGMHSDHD